MVDAFAYEFGETERYIKAAEAITGQPYVWGACDLLCLPPSFPYGGMENPCLIFVTPTLLAGDRSLAGVVAHEVAHSWTGNLLTNHTWEHFWLNEGWTVWLERRIQARLDGEQWYEHGATDRALVLAETIEQFGAEHSFTSLTPILDELDPDDAFSVIPYEKGFLLLHYLSTITGAALFGEFVTAYISQFKFKTLTGADFRAFFTEWCTGKGIDSSAVDWEAWLINPGAPPVEMAFGNTVGAQASDLAKRWLKAEGEGEPEGCTAEAVKGWMYAHWTVFLDEITSAIRSDSSRALSLSRLKRMDELYSLTASHNSEIRLRWQRLCMLHRADFIVPHVISFATAQGRMKFVRPLYRDLYAWEEQRQTALDTFREHADHYHPIARKMLAQDLKLSQ